MSTEQKKSTDGETMQVSKKEFDTMVKELHEGRKSTKLILEKNAELMTANRELMLIGLLKQALLMLEKRMNHDTDELNRLKKGLDSYQNMEGQPKAE